MRRFLMFAAAIARKDLLSEIRGREFLPAMALFGVLVVLVTSFAIEPGIEDGDRVRSGVLWIALTFAFVLGVGRSFQTERQNEAIRGLLASPVGRPAIYLGKLFANVVFLFVSGAVILAFFAVVYDLESPRAIPPLLAVLFLCALGFAGVGTLFAALTLGLRSRDAVLSVLLFPLLSPLILAGSRSTQALLAGQPLLGQGFWLVLMAVYDVVFVVISLLVFDYVLEE